MRFLKNGPLVWGVVLAAVVVSTAAGQATNVKQQIVEGQHLRALGRYDEARRVFASVYQDVKTGQAESGVEPIVLDNLGITEQDDGNYAEAELDFNRALSILHPRGAEDPILAALKTHLAELYVAEQRPADAEPLLRQAAAGLRTAVQPNRMALSLAYNDLGVVCALQRKYSEAETLLRQALAILESEVAANDPTLAGALLTYAGLLVTERRAADAVAPAERAWQILRDSPVGLPDPFISGAMSVIGAVYFQVGRLAEAESFTRQALERAEAAYGPDHPRVGAYLANYAAILKQTDHKAAAKAMQRRADAILAHHEADSFSGHTINISALR